MYLVLLVVIRPLDVLYPVISSLKLLRKIGLFSPKNQPS